MDFEPPDTGAITTRYPGNCRPMNPQTPSDHLFRLGKQSTFRIQPSVTGSADQRDSTTTVQYALDRDCER